jgi:hypothetical protein
MKAISGEVHVLIEDVGALRDERRRLQQRPALTRTIRSRRMNSWSRSEKVRTVVFVGWMPFLSICVSGTGYAAGGLVDTSDKGVTFQGCPVYIVIH